MEANVTFIYDCIGMTIQCKKTDKMKDICQRYSAKLGIGLKLLTFLYGGKPLDFELTLNETNPSDDETKILVTKNELDGLICPKCGENIIVDKESIDEIIQNMNNIKETIRGIKVMIENVIKNSTVDIVNIQLKNANHLLYLFFYFLYIYLHYLLFLSYYFHFD